MALPLFHRLALHPALLLIFLILPFVILSAVVRRIRTPQGVEEAEEYVLIHP